MNAFYNSRRRSAREIFAACPRRFQGEYLQGVVNESNATRRGDLFHEARSLYIQALAKAAQSSDVELAQDAWRRASVAHQVPAAEYWDAQRLFLAWIERYEFNATTFYNTERNTFCKEMSSYLRFDEARVIDGDHFQVTDAKTHWRMPPIDTIRESVQTGLYSVGARWLYPGFSRYEIRYDFVRFNQQVSVVLSPAELDQWEQWVMASDEALDIAEQTNSYPAHPGEQCGTCNVTCHVADHPQAQPIRVMSLEEAKAAAERIAVRDRQNELDKQALKEWCGAKGPVSVGGIEWAHRESISRKYPAQQVLAILAESAVQFPLWLSASALKPLLGPKAKCGAVVTASIATLAVESKTTRFSAKKTGSDDKPETTTEEV